MNYQTFVKQNMPHISGPDKMKQVAMMWHEYKDGNGLKKTHTPTPKLRGGKLKGGKIKKNADDILFEAVFHNNVEPVGAITKRGGAIRKRVPKRQPKKKETLVVLNNGMVADLSNMDLVYGLKGINQAHLNEMIGGKAFKNTKFGHFLYGIGDVLKNPKTLDVITKVAPLAMMAL
jgi:hypothetical protein